MARPPRAFPWEKQLPWAPATLRESAAVGPERAGRAHAFACATGADAPTSRGVGTNATARIPNANGRSVAGRPRDDRPDTVRMPPSKPTTPRPRKRAASAPKKPPRSLQARRLRPRVVTQLRNFFAPLCDRPGCHEHPPDSPRNPARYCSATCRQAVRNVQDRERKWRSRGTLDGRKKRAIEYEAARRRRQSRSGHCADRSSARAPPR